MLNSEQFNMLKESGETNFCNICEKKKEYVKQIKIMEATAAQ